MLVSALVVGLTLTACGSSISKPAASSASAPVLAPPTAVVVQVGDTRIAGATYNHWMAIGAATVEMPQPGRSLPQPVEYEPPAFTACVAHLRTSAAKSATTAQLTARCKRTFESIQRRILNFLITGYWMRGAATEHGSSVSEAEVRERFQEERRAHYPTAASFRRLQQTSHQTVPDLMFALQTQMLSAKLLESFTTDHSHLKSEQATIAAFNKSIRSKWTARTDCKPGYVIRDCRQYKP
jgi:hypothetical protein